MGNVMSTGLSGLLAMQRALDTTSHNIANANTEGYVRQRVDLRTRVASPAGNGWVGNGVEVGTVRRQVNDYLVDQSRSGSSTTARLEVVAGEAARVSNLLGEASTGLSATVQRLQNAVQTVATEPGSMAARQTLLGEAQGLVDRLKGFDERLGSMEESVSSRLRSETADINNLAQSIARLNRDIAGGYAETDQPPNDLLDARDRLLDELATKVTVTTVPQERGVLNVFIGNGQALVVNQSASKLTTVPDSFDVTRPRVLLEGNQGTSDVTASLSGGSVGGLLDFRSQVLDPARSDLGRIAAGLTEAMNEQHRAGLDLKGALGGDFFSFGAPSVMPSGTNTGSATVRASIESSGALTGTDYQLDFTGGRWMLRRADGGGSVPTTGTGTSADPLRAEGVAFQLSGTPAEGDRYLVRPTRDGLEGLALNIKDPTRIAAAAPIRAEAAAANLGRATISPGEVVDPANPSLRQAVTLEFTGPGSYSINGSGSYPYTSGAPIQLNGWSVTLEGTPAAGDRFTVKDNSAGVGDNRNALAMADALAGGRLDGGRTSVADAAIRATTGLGLTTQQAQVGLEAETVMRDEAITQRQSVSGVNLDEEAANLLRYQQAYQAAAQLVRVANEMFRTLLDSTR